MAAKAKKTESSAPTQQGTAVEVAGLLVPATREEQVRFRAFEIYLERGSEPGFELEDWLRAESELGI